MRGVCHASTSRPVIVSRMLIDAVDRLVGILIFPVRCMTAKGITGR